MAVLGGAKFFLALGASSRCILRLCVDEKKSEHLYEREGLRFGFRLIVYFFTKFFFDRSYLAGLSLQL